MTCSQSCGYLKAVLEPELRISNITNCTLKEGSWHMVSFPGNLKCYTLNIAVEDLITSKIYLVKAIKTPPISVASEFLTTYIWKPKLFRYLIFFFFLTHSETQRRRRKAMTLDAVKGQQRLQAFQSTENQHQETSPAARSRCSGCCGWALLGLVLEHLQPVT